MKKLFGTDGIRGKADVFPLDKITIRKIGKSITKHFEKTNGELPRFITGRDTRESGTWIEEAFHTGAVEAGAMCESAGIITTPGVAYLTKKENFDAGIVVSASHNPYEDNGLKVFLPSGRKLDSDTETKIENDIFSNKENNETRNDYSVDTSKVTEYQKIYLNHLHEKFSDLTLPGLKIVLDCANGASSNLAPQLFEKFGATVFAIYNEPNGQNINKDCGSLHLEKLQAKVIEEKADFGVAFDGDADRSLFVDDRGELVDGDATLWVMAQHLQNEGKLNNDTVVATVMSNLGLEIALKSRRIKLLRTAVGDKYVLQELLKTNASIGGEQSGHIIFPNRSLVGDGMQTALYLLEALQQNGKTLSEMRLGFIQFPQILVNVKVGEKLPFEDVPLIMESARQIEGELGDTGRLLLRYSGTENLARVMIEGKDQGEIESKANRLAVVIKDNLE